MCVCVCVCVCACACACVHLRGGRRGRFEGKRRSPVSPIPSKPSSHGLILVHYIFLLFMWSFDQFGPYVRPLPSRVNVDPTNTCAGPLLLSLTISFSPSNLVAFSCLSHFFSSPSAVHFVNGDVHLRRTHAYRKECGKSLGDSFVSSHTHIHKHPTTICAHQGARFRILSPSSAILTFLFTYKNLNIPCCSANSIDICWRRLSLPSTLSTLLPLSLLYLASLSF